MRKSSKKWAKKGSSSPAMGFLQENTILLGPVGADRLVWAWGMERGVRWELFARPAGSAARQSLARSLRRRATDRVREKRTQRGKKLGGRRKKQGRLAVKVQEHRYDVSQGRCWYSRRRCGGENDP